MFCRASVASFYITMLVITCCRSADASYFIQVNQDGFGSIHTTGGIEVKTMAVFKDKLYVGANNQTDGAQIMCFDGAVWHRAAEPGFGTRDNIAISALYAADEFLYAGTANRNGGEIWRYDGSEWICLHKGTFGKTLSKTISALAVFQGRLYAGLWDQLTSKPAEVWAFDGEASWEQVNEPGFGSPHNLNTLAFAVSRVDGTEKLYALVWKSFQYRGTGAGCEVWAFDGSKWQKINEGREGFGEKGGNGRVGIEPYSIAEFQGKLYVGTWAFEGGKYWEVWAYDGKDWELSNSSVAGSGNEMRLCIALQPYNGRLYAVATDAMKEFEVWGYDGKDWIKIIGKECATPENLGDPTNKVVNAMAVYQGYLYLGVSNSKSGYRVFKSRFPEITPQKKILAVGEMELFSLPGAAAPIEWRISNPAIASIEKTTGLVQAVAPGECVVSATDRFGYSPTPMTLTIEKNENQQTEKILIFASIDPPQVANNNKDKAIIKAIIYKTAGVQAVNNVQVNLSSIQQGVKECFDTGAAGDAKASDGIYSLTIAIPRTIKPGIYTLPVTAHAGVDMQGQAEVMLKVKQRYAPPQVVGLKTMGNCYHIPVLFDITNPDQDQCSVTVEYQEKGGEWLPASIEAKSGVVFKKGLLTNLETASDVSRFICVWNSENDIGKKSGTFLIRLTPQDDQEKGSTVVSAPIAIDNKKPPANVMVTVPEGNFEIDKYEYPNHFGYYPEVNVTWSEARTKCQVQGKELCTPEQWELAYYGIAKKRYPYGDVYGFKDRDYCNTVGSADAVMTPSGVYENCVNDLGVYDMGGNIFEWVGLDEKNTFMAGQSYLYETMVQSLFNIDDPTHRHYFLGLRCCKSRH